MTKTTNYSLPQWEATDALKRSDFNEAMATIDTKIKVAANAAAAVSSLKIVWGTFNMDGTEEYGAVLAEYEPDFQLALVWSSTSTPAVILPGDVTRMYFGTWGKYRDIIADETAFTLASCTCTNDDYFRYVLFY